MNNMLQRTDSRAGKEVLMKEEAKKKAKALLSKRTKGKSEEIILKLDAFSKDLPRDIPKDMKYRSCYGICLSILLYAVLAIMGTWFFDVITSAGLDLDSDEDPPS